MLVVSGFNGRQLTNADVCEFITGNWIATTPIPDQSLESRETRIEGRDQENLLAFARKLLRWLPEERASAGELLAQDDDFLMQIRSTKDTEST
jgi:hypothetical protein